MRKTPWTGLLALLPALALVFLVGCPSGPNKPKDGEKDKGKVVADGGTKPPGKAEAITAPTDAIIKGTVTIEGTAPKMPEIAAMKEHKEKDFCLKAPPAQKHQQTWIVGDKGGVANVVISLAPPAGKKFQISDALKEPFKKTPAILDQPFCNFVPHVVALYAGVQKLDVKNDAKVSHNVKIESAGPENPAFDKVLEPKTNVELTLSKWKEPIGVQCSIHPWMNAKILVFDNPYFAVTKDDGSFEIRNVPIDTELIVNMWHEENGKVEAKKMSFKKGDNTLDLKISAK